MAIASGAAANSSAYRFRIDGHKVLIAARLIGSPLVDEHALLGRDDVASLQAFIVEQALGRDKVRIYRNGLGELGMLPPLAQDFLGAAPCVLDPLAPFVARDFRLAGWKIVVERGRQLGLSETQGRTGETKAEYTGDGCDRPGQLPKPHFTVTTSRRSHADDSLTARQGRPLANVLIFHTSAYTFVDGRKASSRSSFPGGLPAKNRKTTPCTVAGASRINGLQFSEMQLTRRAKQGQNGMVRREVDRMTEGPEIRVT